MSSPQVTFQDLVTTWKALADKSHVDFMKVDMQNFFLQCKNDAQMSIADLARRKNQILQIWVDLDWNTAKKNNPHWNDQQKWRKRFSIMDNAFGAILKEVYGMSSAPVQERKPQQAPIRKPNLKVVGSTYDAEETVEAKEFYEAKGVGFTSREQLIAHRNKMMARERGE